MTPTWEERARAYAERFRPTQGSCIHMSNETFVSYLEAAFSQGVRAKGERDVEILAGDELKDTAGLGHRMINPTAYRAKQAIQADTPKLNEAPALICVKHPIMRDELCATCWEAKDRNDTPSGGE